MTAYVPPTIADPHMAAILRDYNVNPRLGACLCRALERCCGLFCVHGARPALRGMLGCALVGGAVLTCVWLRWCGVAILGVQNTARSPL